MVMFGEFIMVHSYGIIFILLNYVFRCHLPTGSICWLCSTHRKGNRITVLRSDVATTGQNNTLISEDQRRLVEKVGESIVLEDYSADPSLVVDTLEHENNQKEIKKEAKEKEREGSGKRYFKQKISSEKLKAASNVIISSSSFTGQHKSRACNLL